MVITKNNKPLLSGPSVQIYYPERWTWQDYLRELELRCCHWVVKNKLSMQDVNAIMQDLYPGPYRVVEKYLLGRMVIGFSLEFDDPKEKTFWLLKNS